MRSVFIFDDQTDILFYKRDEEFAQHVKKQARRSGLLSFSSDSSIDDDVDLNVLVQMFAPLVAGQRLVIDTLDDSFSSVQCENGFLFVFQQHGDCMYVAINGDKKESEETLNKKLDVLHRTLGFLHGPVSRSVRGNTVDERNVRWSLVQSLLDTWSTLYVQEQSFLVEAIERIYVHQVRTESGICLTEHCVKTLESLVGRVQSAGEKHACHALLLVDCKLLALYSSRNSSELHSADLLLTILAMRALYPCEKFPGMEEANLVETFSEVFESCLETSESSDQEKFYSPPSSPLPQQKALSKVVTKKGKSPPKSKNKHLVHKVAQLAGSRGRNSSSSSGGSGNVTQSSLKPPPQQPGNKRETAGSPLPDSTATEEEQSYKKLTVMLQTANSRFTPYHLHSLPIYPGITLVVLCKSSRAKYAVAVNRFLGVLEQLEADRTGVLYNKQTVDLLDACIRQIEGSKRKLIGLAKLVTKIKKFWTNVKRQSVFMIHPSKTENSDLYLSRVESAMATLKLMLQQYFRMLFLMQPESATDVPNPDEVWTDIQKFTRASLSMYRAIIDAKAIRNIPITAYQDQFEGLVHFIFVDRINDLLIAPSINIQMKHHDGNRPMLGEHKLLYHVWRMVRRIQTFLKEGYTTATWEEGDFFCSYFLWFEDASLNPLVIPTVSQLKSLPNPGILGGDFYSSFASQFFPNVPANSLRCYELMCIHLAVMPRQVVVEQCRRLAEMLWEQSGDSHTPLSLLY